MIGVSVGMFVCLCVLLSVAVNFGFVGEMVQRFDCEEIWE